MLNYLLLCVLLPCLITGATVQCPDGCPEGKQCCPVDGQYECCESQIHGLESVAEPRLAAAMHGNFRNNSMTVQNGFNFGCSSAICSGTCCSNDIYSCCPSDWSVCCERNACCRTGQVCCPPGCCQAGTTCCGGGCCSIFNKCCAGSNACCQSESHCCGTGCCAPGSKCCGNNGCCPVGSECCGDKHCCRSGTKCCNGKWCCKNSQRCGLYLNTCISAGLTLVPTVTFLVAMIGVSMMSKFSI